FLNQSIETLTEVIGKAETKEKDRLIAEGLIPDYYRHYSLYKILNRQREQVNDLTSRLEGIGPTLDSYETALKNMRTNLGNIKSRRDRNFVQSNIEFMERLQSRLQEGHDEVTEDLTKAKEGLEKM